MDWAAARGWLVLDDGTSVRRRSLREILTRDLAPLAPIICVIESTFEIYDPVEHNALLELSPALGITLRTLSPRGTAARRAASNRPTTRSAPRKACWRATPTGGRS